MLKLYYNCFNCGANDNVDDIENLDGCCPKCHSHHSEVVYGSSLKLEEFISELSNMSEHDIVKYAQAIQICAKNYVDSLY